MTVDEGGNAVFAGNVKAMGSFTTLHVVAPYCGAMTATSRVASSQADVRLAAYDSAGKMLTLQYDRSLTNVNSTITFDVREKDEYFVVVVCEGFTTGDFWVTLRSLPQDRERITGAVEESSRSRSGVMVEAQPSETFSPPND